MNVRAGEIRAIIDSWAREQLHGGSQNQPLFLAHLSLLSSALEKLSQTILAFEAGSIGWGEFRIEDRIKDPTLAVEHDVYKHRMLIQELDRILLNLESFETILQGLQNLKYKSWIPSMQEVLVNDTGLKYQADAWMMNTFNKLKIVRGRLEYLSKRSCAFETIILRFASYQKHNSMEAAMSHMKQLADANKEATRELSELTRETRHDAVLMKYLAEITVVFLPLTAVSTFFSMTFFAIDTTSTALLPFSSLRYIWIFVLFAVLISATMYLYWWSKSTRIQREKQREIDRLKQREAASETAAMAIAQSEQRARLEKERRLELAELRYAEATAVEERLRRSDEATADELQMAQAETASAMAELMVATLAVSDLTGVQSG